MTVFTCSLCNFTTNKKTRYDRHCESSRHKTLHYLLSVSDDEDRGDRTPERNLKLDVGKVHEVALDSDDDDGDLTFIQKPLRTTTPEEHHEDFFQPKLPVTCNINERNQEVNAQALKTEWWPFSSKVECFLYIFMNSATHPVSDEVVKFGLFMLLELGILDVPSLQHLKNLKVGKFSWEDLVTKEQNNENIPVWSIRPSQVLKLCLSHPETAKILTRNEVNPKIEQQSNGERMKELVNVNANNAVEDRNGLPILTLPVNLFMDDTSTHKSRRWMPFHCVQMQMSNLPVSVRQQQRHIHFLGATEKGSIMDVLKVVVNDIKEHNINGIEGFDAGQKMKCIIKPAIAAGIADFQMLSYCCNHLGATAKLYCPRCYSDSDHFMTLGRRRTPDVTKQHLAHLDIHTDRNKKAFRTQKGIKEHENVLWDVMDPHRDIPVGMLHLIPLGLAKHVIQNVFDNANERVLAMLMAHLLDIHPGARFVNFDKHLSSRQGKDFKTYLQIAPLNMSYAGVSSRQIKVISSLALLQKKLLKPAFSEDDIDGIREDVRNFHQLLYQYMPELTSKVKVHLLLHLVEDIKRHGPPIGYMEDAFEKNHGNIRSMVFQQNQKARSRDTSVCFAKQIICSHVVTGGYFESDNAWEQAADNVLHLAKQTPVQSHLGLKGDLKKKRTAGKVSLLRRDLSNHPVKEDCQDVLLQVHLEMMFNMTDNYTVMRGKGISSQDGTLIHSDEWVEYNNEHQIKCFGIFKEGLVLTSKKNLPTFVARIQKAEILGEKENCCFKLKLSAVTYIQSKNVKCKAPVVHDCNGGRCRIVEQAKAERVEQEIIVSYKFNLKHNNNHKVYLLNVYAIDR